MFIEIICEIARLDFESDMGGSCDNTYNAILTLIFSMTKDMCFDAIFVKHSSKKHIGSSSSKQT